MTTSPQQLRNTRLLITRGRQFRFRESAADLTDQIRAAIEAAAFTWRPDIQAFTHPGQDRETGARIAALLAGLGHNVLAY
ncbi:hypothetical protein GCM10010121_095710 [Streptomyces brasiliensis]|uniref:Uncharacterized protein n=1 Tax=Streptomyces brasiliensis TaxID=1954 RepID=A0A917PBS3_9ACTN|nr:hypothetical protein GCM10010121_095710 [Streptomyces brasiliensis]